MTVAFLGRADSGVLAHLRAVGEDVLAIGPDDELPPAALAADRIVSHGYRRILRPATLAAAPDRFVNLHIALLPFNRGADPTLWSVLEDTPSGVTIHHIDPGVDTGDVIAQREVPLAADDTLATAYDRLQAAMLDLFAATWPLIAAGTAPRTPQPPGGTAHRIADRAAVEHLLTEGWDTPVAALRGRWRSAAGGAPMGV